jgi:hypothetical protein
VGALLEVRATHTLGLRRLDVAFFSSIAPESSREVRARHAVPAFYLTQAQDKKEAARFAASKRAQGKPEKHHKHRPASDDHATKSVPNPKRLFAKTRARRTVPALYFTAQNKKGGE